MYLQRAKVLRRQGNGRGRSIDRHGIPELLQLHQTLRNASEVRKGLSGVRATRIPILCGRQVHQVCYCSGGNDEGTKLKQYGRLKEHLSYGGRATLRRCPFFMPSNTWFSQGSPFKLEKTSKQTRDFVLHFIVFACLRRARSASRLETGNIQARKDKQAIH